MSKIPVGEGFIFPDDTEQVTAGIPDTEEEGLSIRLSGQWAKSGSTTEFDPAGNDFNDEYWDGQAGDYGFSGLGSTYSNPPLTLVPTATYFGVINAYADLDSTVGGLQILTINSDDDPAFTDGARVYFRVSQDPEAITSEPFFRYAMFQDLSGLALKTNVLELDNVTPFVPDNDYEPATKKYVDDTDLGYVLATWGANLQTAGRFPAINGTSNGPEISGLGIDASAQVSAEGTIDTITYYNATGDNTTQFKIILNGQVAYTFTCVAPYGQEMGIGVPVVMNDNVALEYDAGTKPANGIYTMYIN